MALKRDVHLITIDTNSSLELITQQAQHVVERVGDGYEVVLQVATNHTVFVILKKLVKV